jgi:hypothetical protein
MNETFSKGPQACVGESLAFGQKSKESYCGLHLYV